MAPLNKLYLISIGCTAACLGMGYAFHRKFVQEMSKNPLYVEALEIVKNHRGVISFLGEPIESKMPVLANKGILLAGFSDVQVKVIGPKSDGIVFMKIIKDDDKVKVDTIHLQIGQDHSKRLVVKKSDKSEIIPQPQ